jgi:hypothetical protein
MKNKDKPMGSKNPTIQSMLQHLAEAKVQPEKMDLWPAVRAKLTTSKTLLQPKEFLMNKKFTFTALAAVLVLSIVVAFMANNVTTVSAKEVLDRAYQVQTQPGTNQGIEHIRSEIYTNIEAKEQGMDTIVESYSEPVSGNFRVVTTDKESGKVLQVSAFDGSNAYTSDNLSDDQQNDGPLTVYRNPLDRNSLYLQKFTNGTDQKLNPALDTDAKNMFDKMRHDPAVELLDQETWDTGRTVYVLRSQQEIKLLVENEITHPLGWVTFYFDTETYQLLGNRVTMEKDGQEMLISWQRVVVDEILTEESNIAWDLSDLQGLNIVDDLNHEHDKFGAVSSNVISVEDLASKTDSAYLLKTIPDGFSLEVTTQPKQAADEPFFYQANYVDQTSNYFIIRTLGKPLEGTSKTDETYTTASGFVLYFIGQPGTPAKGGEFTSTLIEAPNGKTYMIDSTLPHDTIKTFAEDLVLVK